ncbi:MobF family relaxase [Kordiimonas lipolytica]|uniref:MobF family relaxase n=2 Tax=Pseudomonadota TaxID=1224 RepID=A0ABV8U865_9PROT|nr:MobF family relaxase [Kordiimonas lipolytica]
MIGNIRKIHDGEVFAYLAEDNYYVNDDTVRDSAWFGELARTRKLIGPINQSCFADQVAQNATSDVRGKPVLGFDIVFSAPKSTSILALAFDRDEIRHAHQEAVRAALAYIEQNCLTHRIYDRSEKRQTLQQSCRALFATFEHHENRALEPQLHTHCLLLQQTEDSSGRVRALETHRLFLHKLAAGTLYQNEFARRLHELGYQTRWDMGKGTFEIVGVPQNVTEEFSTRRAEILEQLKETGKSSHRRADLAALFTRAAKPKNIDRKELKRTWLVRAEQHGFLPHHAYALRDIEPVKASVCPRAIIDQAVSHLSQMAAVFEKRHLTVECLKRARGYIAGSLVLDAIEQAIAEGAILTAPENGDFLTTPAMQALEASLLDHEKDGRSKIAPVYSELEISRAVRDVALDRDQLQAVAQVLASSSRVVGIQGYAGTGKTTLLSAVLRLAAQKRQRLIALAPSTQAAKLLQAETQIPANTVQFFLTKYGKLDEGTPALENARAAFAGSILLIDEASMLSSNQVADLFELQKKLQIARIVLVGDREQLNAVEAGRPFELLQRAGMECAKVRTIRRQKNEVLKGAVIDTIKKDIAAAFQKLGPDIVENDEQDLCYLAAQTWLNQPLDKRQRSLILTQTRVERHLVNSIVRAHKQYIGELSGDSVMLPHLTSKNMSVSQLRDANFYEAGDVVLFNKRYARLGVDRGTYAKVLQVNQQDGSVRLRVGYDIKTWRPDLVAGNAKGAIDVFQHDQIELAQGDEIRFTRNFPRHGIMNGTQCQVLEVGDKTVRLRKQNGEILVMNRDQASMRHIDYAWASTTYSAQGKTVDEVHVVASSQKAHMNTAQSLYVQVSRARSRAHVYTDNREALEMQVMKSLQPKPRHAVDLAPQSSFMQQITEAAFAFSNKMKARRLPAKRKPPPKPQSGIKMSI